MTLIVEDGTGKADAESYSDVAFADAYHARRLNSEWAPLDAAIKEAHLIKATEYLDAKYGAKWIGSRKIALQALSWPRVDAVVDGVEVDADSVPIQIVRACAELAFKSFKLAGQLQPDLKRAKLKVKVDVIETEYDPNSPEQTRYQAVETMIAPFIQSAFAQVRLERA
ncbi:DnaT-like ssDNA-binding protein [Methylovorus glucosotrophus]|uniref:Putative DnaT-like domain-containing protein n=1 Tax=Methylovorus glucosotrophus (strain SIP3-4) TaxID=582744 RepID=C6XE94_METGS|nr:DnaT-like ssDNA-binding protein [Methylovorus glucosotrophus]ACT50869.1 conserved hypothetical protein [Methylovorus glucosotrophus SIP3-4]